MSLDEKLRRLARNMNLAVVAKDAGIPLTTLHGVVKTGHSPRVPTLIAIAKGFSVDPAWLIDDSRGWPPVRFEQIESEPVSAA